MVPYAKQAIQICYWMPAASAKQENASYAYSQTLSRRSRWTRRHTASTLCLYAMSCSRYNSTIAPTCLHDASRRQAASAPYAHAPKHAKRKWGHSHVRAATARHCYRRHAAICVQRRLRHALLPRAFKPLQTVLASLLKVKHRCPVILCHSKETIILVIRRWYRSTERLKTGGWRFMLQMSHGRERIPEARNQAFIVNAVPSLHAIHFYDNFTWRRNNNLKPTRSDWVTVQIDLRWWTDHRVLNQSWSMVLDRMGTNWKIFQLKIKMY
jgi:hypothetical protein